MRIRRRRDGAVLFSEIHSPVRLALMRLPLHAATGPDDPAAARLFPSPGSEPELGATWSEWVRPELEGAFDQSLAVVRNHLRRSPALRTEPAGAMLILPAKRAAWMNVLNRARLAIFERAGFSEADLDGELPAEIRSERDLLKLEMLVYQIMLSILVDLESQGIDGV